MTVRLFLGLILLVCAAMAGSPPVTCEAVLVTPVDECTLQGEWSASGTGKNAAQAEKRARERLADGVTRMTDARALQAAGTVAAARAEPDRIACPAVLPKRTKLSCFPDPELTDMRTCYADFPAPDCWSGEILILEDVAWRATEEGRGDICEKLDAAMAASHLPPAEQAICSARCRLEARVRCPAE